MPEKFVSFVHISDSHIGPTADYARHGQVSLPCSERVVRLINDLPVQPDFVVHTGDVVTNPHPAAYRLAVETFSRLNTPVYYATGNHDRPEDLHHFFPMGPKEDLLPGRNALTYRFYVKGYQFLVLDGRGPDEIDPHGILSDAQLQVLRAEARPDGPPLAIFVHYPTLPLNSPWMDRNMRLLNWQPFHEALLPARERLRGVFYGHVHQNMQTVRDGIHYVSVASLFSQFTAWPTDVETGFDPDHPPGYNFVTLQPQQTIIHQHVFLRPQ